MQNDSIDNLRLDMNKKSVRGVIYVRAGDTRARTIHITLANNGTVVDLSEAVICELLIHKPDESVNDQAMVRYGNEVQYTFRTQDINVPGECNCQVMITFSDGTVVTSPEFSVMVYQKVVDQSLEKSTNEYTAITEILNDVTDLRNQASQDADRAETAREGVESYEEQCATHEENASDSATAASESASEAADSADSALANMNLTKEYRDDAETFMEETRTNLAAVEEKASEILGYDSSAKESAEDAADSAEAASNSATDASTYASSAESYKDLSKSYAVGTNGVTRAGDATDNAKYYYEQARDISETLAGTLRPKGTVAFANLPSLASADEGDMYNVSDAFVTDERFKEGSGVSVPAGSNVYKTADSYWDILAGSPVTGVKGDNESTYRRGNVNITKGDIGLGDVPNVTTNNQTPTFSEASSRANIISGETVSTLFGKIKKFFSDLKTVAFSGSYSDLSDLPTLGTSSALDVAASGDASTTEVVKGDDTRLHNVSANPVTTSASLTGINIDGTSYKVSGGHAINDQDGSTLTQRETMTFLDAHLSDNSTDESTDIEIIQSVSESDWENVTEDGLYDVDIEGVDIGPASDEYVEVTADGVKSWGALLVDLYSKVDKTKLDGNSYFERTDSPSILYRFYIYGATDIRFTYVSGTSSNYELTIVRLANALADTAYTAFYTTTTSTTRNDVTGNTPTSGTKLRVHYGNKYSVIDLQTTANRCLLTDGTTVQSRLDTMLKAYPISGSVTYSGGTVAVGGDISTITNGVVTKDTIKGMFINGQSFIGVASLLSDKSSFNVWTPSALTGTYNYIGVILY